MNNKKARVSIGLPVFNGELYLEQALESLLAQSYEDFELIICDNASTDRTQDICHRYAARDQRIRYYRNQVNIGAVQNWYRTFELSSCEYFAGAADDDVYDPEFLRKCVDVLDHNSAVAVCYTKAMLIDEHGNFVRNFDVEIDTTSPKPYVRLYNVIGIDYLCIQLFGVMRACVFGKTQVYAGYYGCDRNTLAELCLWGQVYEIPEYLFFHRIHANALGAARNSGRSLHELLVLDPGTNWRSRFPSLTRFRNYFATVARMPLTPFDRVMCFVQLVRLVIVKSTIRIKHGYGR